MSKIAKKPSRKSNPATKQDLGELRKETHTMGSDIRKEMKIMGSEIRKEMSTMGSDIRNEMKIMGSDIRNEMKIMGSDIRKEISDSEYRILEQMTLLLEHHRHDIIGATKDDIVSLKTRVTRLEHHAGLAV